MKPAAPNWLTDQIALEEWDRVVDKVSEELLGVLANYCRLHAVIANAEAVALQKMAPIVGQYRTLAAALFGRGSQRVQPGKNPFTQLKDRAKRRAPRKKKS